MIHDSDFDQDDELATLAAEASARNPGFAGALEDSTLRNSIRSQLTKIRRRLRISQTQVAERMQTTQSAVSDFENGSADPYFSTLQRYARAVTARLVVTIDLPHDSPWCETWRYERSSSAVRVHHIHLARASAPGAEWRAMPADGTFVAPRSLSLASVGSDD